MDLQKAKEYNFKKEQNNFSGNKLIALNCNGYYTYYYDSGAIKIDAFDDNSVREEFNVALEDSKVVEVMINSMFTKPIYDIFSGMDFLEEVKEGYIIKNDGSVVNVFVDGYATNIGFRLPKYTCGEFMVSEYDWKELCSKHKVLVNFAHK